MFDITFERKTLSEHLCLFVLRRDVLSLGGNAMENEKEGIFHHGFWTLKECFFLKLLKNNSALIVALK